MTSITSFFACRRAIFTCTSQRVRSLSTTASASASSRLVISRRAWQGYAKTLDKKAKPKAPKPEDKPWPQNVKIAGGIAAGIFIPYSIVWFISGDPALRDMFQGILPLESLREHFGEVEWDAQSYADKDEPLDTGYYSFPMEWSFEQRRLEQDIENRDDTNITANLYLLGDHEIKQTKQVKASIRANRESLVEVLGSSDDNSSVAVDFEEDMTGDFTTDMAENGVEEMTIPVDSILDLRQRTHTFSNWYHVSNHGQQEQEQQKMSQTELDLSRLEHTIATIENNLKDPSCTRDIDDMTSELREAKRELRRLKWKKRLSMT